jgi:hypothetical protein
VNFLSTLDELVKLGFVSHEEASRAVDRLESLEKERPTAGQVARYGVLGAGAGVLGKAVSHSIEHGRLPTARGALGAAASGAIGMGAVPLVRRGLDQHAEVGRLRKYMQQEHVGEYASNPAPATHAPPFESGGKIATIGRLKIGAMGTFAIPPPSAMAGALKKMPLIPKAGRAPVIGSGDFGRTLHVSPNITAATQHAATIAPHRGTVYAG